jgi:hypothetical protein
MVLRRDTRPSVKDAMQQYKKVAKDRSHDRIRHKVRSEPQR